MLVAMGGAAIIFAVLNLLSAKVMTILSSSIVGTAMIAASVDFFMHGLKTIVWVIIIKSRIYLLMIYITCIFIYFLTASSTDCQHQTQSHATAVLGWRVAVRLAGRRTTVRLCANVHNGVAR